MKQRRAAKLVWKNYGQAWLDKNYIHYENENQIVFCFVNEESPGHWLPPTVDY